MDELLSERVKPLYRNHLEAQQYGRIQSTVLVTERAISHLGLIHRQTMNAALLRLRVAERQKQAASSSWDASRIDAATRQYLDQLTALTEAESERLSRLVSELT